MPHTIQTAAVRINRARNDAQAGSGANDIFAEGLSVQGKLNNLVLSNVVPGVSHALRGHRTGEFVGLHRVLSDMTFDNFEMNQAPAALGPGIYTFDIIEFTDLLIEGLQQRIRYQVKGIILPEHGTFDRNNRDNRSRPVVLKPTFMLAGGGSSYKVHRDGITRPEHGVNGNQYPFVYCDMAGGPDNGPVWITKLPGLPAEQHLPLRSM